MINSVFRTILNMSLTASFIIIFVILIRYFLKKAPRVISYALWAVVLFRLLCPISFTANFSILSVMNVPVTEKGNIEYIPSDFDDTDTPTITLPFMGENESANSSLPQGDITASVNPVQIYGFIAAIIWICGMIVLFVYSVFKYIRLKRRLIGAVCKGKNVFLTDYMNTAFVLGLFRPRIYLPTTLTEKEQAYILKHEQCHIHRGDHIIKVVAYLALCVHWFNPLVWLAFMLSAKDMEMSCDEAVMNKMGKDIRADYAQSLLRLSGRKRVTVATPLAFGEDDTKSRIKNVLNYRRPTLWVTGIVVIVIVLLGVTLICNPIPTMELPNMQEEQKQSAISLNIEEYYISNTGDPSNLYYIDANNVLWGSGRNEYGQLGQETQDYEFHSDMVKIADNVIHVDYSQKGFAIFLTKDNKLYGIGNAGTGALQQYEEFDWSRYTDGENYAVTTPILLMENVVYACCGRDDIVSQKQDGTVWTWGTIGIENGYLSNNVYFVEKPKKILEDAVLVTGGWFNHAALLQDGTVWTWGYNSAGNCGVEDVPIVNEPTMVAEDVAMIWTDLAVDGYPQPNEEDFARAWTGKLKYNSEYDNIAEFNDIYPQYLNNTVIRKIDGSYWVCGENVGAEEKVVHGAEGDYSIVCTDKFTLCE